MRSPDIYRRKLTTLAFVKKATNKTVEDLARRVVAEIETQVNVLGRGGDIQRAIKIYGRIGETIEHQKITTGVVGDAIIERTMASLFMEDMLGTTEEMLENVFFLPSSVIRRTFNLINAHKMILIMLLFSMFINLFLSGRSTGAYWHNRYAENVMRKAGVTSNKAIVRMVSLKEIDELVTAGLIGANITSDGLWYVTVLYSITD